MTSFSWLFFNKNGRVDACIFADGLEVQKRNEIVGNELLEALVKRVHFDGVTGPVYFHDASADATRRGRGDRGRGERVRRRATGRSYAGTSVSTGSGGREVRRFSMSG